MNSAVLLVLDNPRRTERVGLSRSGAGRGKLGGASFKRGKGEVGMDEYQVRTWHGWHHHMALSLSITR